MAFKIRPLEPSDHAEWDVLWTGYLAYYETQRSADYRARYFARLLDPAPHDYQALVAQGDTGLVGLAHYLFHAHGWQDAPVCYLQDLFAAPETRGQGVGRALIEAVYAEADRCGASGVYWTTQHFNDTARRLYDRVGQLTPFIKYQSP